MGLKANKNSIANVTIINVAIIISVDIITVFITLIIIIIISVIPANNTIQYAIRLNQKIPADTSATGLDWKINKIIKLILKVKKNKDENAQKRDRKYYGRISIA